MENEEQRPRRYRVVFRRNILVYVGLTFMLLASLAIIIVGTVFYVREKTKNS